MPPAEPLPATSGKGSPAPALVAPFPEPAEEPEVVAEAELHPATPSPAPLPSPEPKLPEPESRTATPPSRPALDRPRAAGLPRIRAVPPRPPTVSSPGAAPTPAFRPPAGAPLRAPAGTRLLAGIVDLIAVGTLQSLVVVPVVAYWWSREIPADPAQVGFLPILLSLAVIPVALALGAAYFVWGWGIAGATPGKRLLGLRVEGEDGRCPIGPGRAFVRVLGYAASALLVGLGFALIPLTGDGLHDKIAGTRVVRREGD
jgi:uncharacterized RDD family membrane protein YckC